MLFLLIPPVFFVFAQLWLAFTSRARRAPEIEATIKEHERFRAAMTAGNTAGKRTKIDA